MSRVSDTFLFWPFWYFANLLVYPTGVQEQAGWNVCYCQIEPCSMVEKLFLQKKIDENNSKIIDKLPYLRLNVKKDLDQF